MGKKFYYISLVILIWIAILPMVSFRKTGEIYVTHMKKTIYQPKLEVKGVIESSNQTPIKLSYPVYIKDCYVKEGSFVNKGQLLFTVDTEKMRKSVKNYDFTEYVDAGMTFDKEVLAEISSEIYASDSGYIRDLTANSGTLVLNDESMCVIESENDILLKITVNQEDYSRISVNDKIIFSPDIIPKKEYTAEISRKTAKIRKESSLTGNKTVVDIFAYIDNPDNSILSGMDVTGTLYKPSKEIFTLPYEYINQDENGEYVTILSNGNYKNVYIETGIETDNYAEILTQFDNDALFIKNNQNIKGNSLICYEN